ATHRPGHQAAGRSARPHGRPARNRFERHTTPMSVLITPRELDELSRTSEVRVLDVRWTLAKPDGRDAYLAGHLPGAIYVDLENELAGHGEPTDGRHPLPDIADLTAAARGWGLRRG